MKVLLFHAVAGNPSVAPPLMGQTSNTLRPFSRFISQAIHTAKQRQFRYQLPWQRVRDLQPIRLEAIDSLLRVTRRRPGVVLADWPEGTTPDLSQQGFVLNRGVPFRVEAAARSATGLQVRADVLLSPTDQVIWCGVQCKVREETAPSPPSKVTDLQNRPLRLTTPPRTSEDRFWILVVEGQHGDCDLLVDGEEVEAEALSSSEDLRCVTDQAGRAFEFGGGVLRVEELPAEGLLRGNNGIRFRWSSEASSSRRGNWIQLLPPTDADGDDFLDPRAAFCEGDVREVWTAPRRGPDTTLKVKKVDQDRYQLLVDHYPPEGGKLFLPVDLRNLHLQKRALRQLAESPLPHHQGLLRLCEDPLHARWPNVAKVSIPADGWRALTDRSRSGTDEQRAFVNKALGSQDFAFLEGPPGSGKTTAICEIVQQLVEQGKRVLLCASTHVAIDNVLERLLKTTSPIDAVRIGKLDKVDESVAATQLDVRVDGLARSWRSRPDMKTLGDGELAEMAERTIIMAANLTCGTTMGIVNHPLFRGRDEDLKVWDRPISSMPHWDVLIVDEASKTLIQEFMVPALMAKRWIIVGDVRQLPPFADRADIVANLRDLVNDNDEQLFPPDHQRACLLLSRLLRPEVRQREMRWLMIEPPSVIECIARELSAGAVPELLVVRIAARAVASKGPVITVTAESVRAGGSESLLLAAADWVLVSDDLLPEVSAHLPSTLLFASAPTDRKGAGLTAGDALLMRQAWRLARTGMLPRPYVEQKFRRTAVATMEDVQACESDWLQRHDLAQELAWRLTRCHELRHSRSDRKRKKLREELDELLPRAAAIEDSIAEIEDIGLPSILEVVQDGIGVERSTRRSALTAGLRSTRSTDFAARFERLSYQHRMHPEIASFPREIFYEGQSLKDANTIQIRDAKLGWDFGRFCARRMWADIDGRDQGGVNENEVRAMASVLKEFIAWAKHKGGPGRHGGPSFWEVACLCFYVKQEHAISDMLRAVTRVDSRTRFKVTDAPVEIVCGTVDRFQGREADLVLLSMRNTGRVGFLDSPNRLNVGLTRARQQLVVFGKAEYFQDCPVSELVALAKQTPLVEAQQVHQWRRSAR